MHRWPNTPRLRKPERRFTARQEGGAAYCRLLMETHVLLVILKTGVLVEGRKAREEDDKL